MKQSIKKTNQSAKTLEIYAEFANLTQTTIFYILIYKVGETR